MSAKFDSSVAGTPAVFADSVVARGVEGHSVQDHGVVGKSEQGTGVFGRSAVGIGMEGHSNLNSGVVGESKQGTGVFGISEAQRGVEGRATRDHGVVGASIQGAGVFGLSQDGNGIEGHSTRQIGVFGKGGRLAGRFEGDVEVTGNINLMGPASDIRFTNADCAEDFDVWGASKVEPGTVMVLGNDGTLSQSEHAYDKRVAGVVSGAGNYKPAIVLDGSNTSGNRQPIALLGKVYCKVDAQFGAIQVGNLLTTSPTPGHAMVAADPALAFGTIIGKALRPLSSGEGLIPILVALQ